MRIGEFVLAAVIALLPQAEGQGSYRAPRTSFGAPSFEGVWSTLTATPLERPSAFDGPTTTEDKAKVFALNVPTVFQSDTSDGVGARVSEWWEFSPDMTRIGGQIRTSLIVDPPDGKMPYNDNGRARLKVLMTGVLTNFDGPEARPSTDRCLAGGSGATGAPIFVPRYNANYQFVQTPGYVVISMEQNREVRIIRMSDKRLPDVMKRWMGDSIGRWDGETLVVETSNFVAGDAFKPSSPILISEHARVTERFTRIGPGEILYRYTVDDTELFSRSWSAEMILSATKNHVLEYACHEGNYAMSGMLAGGRAKEKQTK